MILPGFWDTGRHYVGVADRLDLLEACLVHEGVTLRDESVDDQPVRAGGAPSAIDSRPACPCAIKVAPTSPSSQEA